MDHGRSVVGVKAVVGLVLLAGISLAPTSDASGTCSGPALAVETTRKRPAHVRIGAQEVVGGYSFVDGCADGRGDDEEYPMRKVGLSLRQGHEGLGPGGSRTREASWTTASAGSPGRCGPTGRASRAGRSWSPAGPSCR